MPVLAPYTKFPNNWADHNSFPIPGLFAREQHMVHLIKTPGILLVTLTTKVQPWGHGFDLTLAISMLMSCEWTDF